MAVGWTTKITKGWMSTEECEELISVLPLSTVEYAFAYGSGAFQQQGENKSEKMVDFVLCTNDPVTFHTENIEKNSSHYSLLRCIGAKSLVKFQTRLAARVYYNTRVHVGNRRMKYGVISMEDLKRDLLDWRWLYVAGRLHKPVLNELFEKIVSLSYTGDFRMYVGEDKDKIKKIVLGSMEELSDVYNPLLANDSRLVVQNGKVGPISSLIV
ncbi:Phosphatidate cytidylyltransferase mitochondrial [Trichostrongylus colubriformis]|uniref:Phosphatidate cytidylyltransferase, mitochondrial n=1 Tax=Trichostrongylus colubriformis TaxID=6319 RepID=A0AAN8EV55_TRICO